MIVDNLTGTDAAVIISAIDAALRARGLGHRDSAALKAAKHKILCAKTIEEPDFNPEVSEGCLVSGILTQTVLNTEGAD